MQSAVHDLPDRHIASQLYISATTRPIRSSRPYQVPSWLYSTGRQGPAARGGARRPRGAGRRQTGTHTQRAAIAGHGSSVQLRKLGAGASVVASLLSSSWSRRWLFEWGALANISVVGKHC